MESFLNLEPVYLPQLQSSKIQFSRLLSSNRRNVCSHSSIHEKKWSIANLLEMGCGPAEFFFSISRPSSLDENIIPRKQEIDSEHFKCRHVHSHYSTRTSNNCERFFSVAGYSRSFHRLWPSPEIFELQFVHINGILCDISTEHEVV